MRASFAGASCRRALPELMDEGIVTLQAGDALKDAALNDHGPFDAIHVGASAGHIPKVIGSYSCHNISLTNLELVLHIVL